MKFPFFAILLLSFALITNTGCDRNPNQAEAMQEEFDDPSFPDPEKPEFTKGQLDDIGTTPEEIAELKVFPDGSPISSVKVRGSALNLIFGSAYSFGETQWTKYRELKEATLTDPDHPVRWAIMNLDSGEMLEYGLASELKIFGASSSKIYVAATMLDKQEGMVSKPQLQKMADMLVVSSNSAWTQLQKEIGGGNANKGREANYNFTQRMGYPKTRGWQGYWGSIHGNELVPTETVQFLHDTYKNNYPGADWLWKILHTSRTGSTRGRKYIPSEFVVGGKTGTYDGPTENPQTGKEYNVKMRNHVLVVKINGVQLGVAVYANTGSSESVALMMGGLLREHSALGLISRSR